MNELKMRCVESDTSNSPLRRFRWIVLSVADDKVADRRSTAYFSRARDLAWRLPARWRYAPDRVPRVTLLRRGLHHFVMGINVYEDVSWSVL
jgi:hypothetical protein